MINVRTVLTAAAFAAAVASANAAEVKRTIKLHQHPPVLTKVDLAEKGMSGGDMLAFQAQADGDDGLKVTMHGMLITVDIPDGADTLEDRSGQIYFDFGNGDSIVAAGRSVYSGGESEMEKDKPQLRAVIGGTGKYIGAAGQVTTTRRADGSYEQLIELVN